MRVPRLLRRLSTVGLAIVATISVVVPVAEASRPPSPAPAECAETWRCDRPVRTDTSRRPHRIRPTAPSPGLGVRAELSALERDRGCPEGTTRSRPRRAGHLDRDHWSAAVGRNRTRNRARRRIRQRCRQPGLGSLGGISHRSRSRRTHLPADTRRGLGVTRSKSHWITVTKSPASSTGGRRPPRSNGASNSPISGVGRSGIRSKPPRRSARSRPCRGGSPTRATRRATGSPVKSRSRSPTGHHWKRWPSCFAESRNAVPPACFPLRWSSGRRLACGRTRGPSTGPGPQNTTSPVLN